MTPDELHLYQNGGPNGLTGSWTAIRPSGALYGFFSSEQEKDLVLAASGYRLKRGLQLCRMISFLRQREPEIWVRLQS